MAESKKWLSGCAVALLACVITTHAQRPVFEVASIKKSAATTPAWRQTVQPGGRYVATNALLSEIIQFAYEISDVQLVGAPAWVKTARFDISAKAPEEAPERQVRLMVQSLLADRFHLAAHKGQGEMSVQEVVLARDDGRVGPRMAPVASQAECAEAYLRLPKLDIPRGAVMSVLCGPLSSILPKLLSPIYKTASIDRTGLTGEWFVNMYFDGAMPGARLEPNPDLPSFSAALQEQLGLKMRGTRAAVDILTIESIQQPTED